MELQGRVDELRKDGRHLAVISYDPVPVLAEFAARRGITFPLLSDAGSAIIRRFGILNTTVPETNDLFGYPFPGTFILDRLEDEAAKQGINYLYNVVPAKHPDPERLTRWLQRRGFVASRNDGLLKRAVHSAKT